MQIKCFWGGRVDETEEKINTWLREVGDKIEFIALTLGGDHTNVIVMITYRVKH